MPGLRPPATPPADPWESDVSRYEIGKTDGSWPEKAYKNQSFLTSPQARPIRIICEYLEPLVRFQMLGVEDTIVFFGSARTLPPDVAAEALKAVEAEDAASDDHPARLARARRDVDMSRYYDDARQLAFRLTQWAQSVHSNDGNRFAVCSGGGPGIMEAVNRGATEAGGPSIGLNISLPMEQQPNAYQTRELSFEFHYFFIRKFWFTCPARALVAFPGGFGTMDELFELLTLRQTGKAGLDIPIVVYGTEYWNRIVNFEAMVDAGVISPEDLDLIRYFDDVDAAFEFLKGELTRLFLEPSDRCPVD